MIYWAIFYHKMNNLSKKEIRVLVFGVFDIIHDGHRFFLKNAKKLGTDLTVAVATDVSVEKLKGTRPHNYQSIRMENIRNLGVADQVIIGDDALNDWVVIKKIRPDIVALGYDQNSLGEALSRYIDEAGLPISITVLEPLDDGSLHSSQLRDKL